MGREDGETREVPLEFLGNGAQYFRIWIVNVVLIILTLGIYSAWAKVRSRRYFYGNTRIDGSSFEYLASPIAILEGRLIAFFVIVPIGVTAQFFPLISLLMAFALFLIAPLIVVKALRFNARVSSFRGVRFDFERTTLDAYFCMVLLPLFTLLTLGILFPYAQARMASFFFSGHRYGSQDFRDTLSIAPVYVLYLRILAIGVLAGVAYALFILLGVGSAGMAILARPEGTGAAPVLLRVVLYGLILIWVFVVRSMQQAGMTNLLFNSAGVGKVMSFRSTLSTWGLFRIYLGYGLLSLLTLGMAYPWLAVALTRYRAHCTRVVLHSSLEKASETSAPSGSAVMDELAEGLDLDVGLGF